MDVAASPDLTHDARSAGFDVAWPGRVFAGLAVIACVFAFVGLPFGAFWTDELFTLYLVDHHGGFAEVIRRSLTDTHPPAYYLILYAWAQVFGVSEAALRSLSALFCVGAVGIFAFATGRAFSAPARAFAAAAAGASAFWFFQSQNVRNYGLGMLAVSALVALALRARAAAREGRAPGAGVIVGLFAAGLLASFTHFYAFLATGAVVGFLILTIPQTRFRLAAIALGLVILALELAYVRMLVGHTQQDLHGLWFSNDPAFLLNELLHVVTRTLAPGTAAVLVLALAARAARRVEAAAPLPDAGWAAGLAGFALLTVIGFGLLISVLFAPSFSDMNVMIASPFLWGLAAAAYDLGGPRAGRPWPLAAGLLLAALMAAQLAALLPGRWMSRTEQWRTSAEAAAALPGCKDQPAPAVMPARFAAPTPFFLRLFERHFYGHYFPGPVRVYPQAAFIGAAPEPGLRALLIERATNPAACPLLAWAAHDMSPDQAAAFAQGLARTVSKPPGSIRIWTFYERRARWLGFKRRASAFLFLARR
jgi:hypothetical protein